MSARSARKDNVDNLLGVLFGKERFKAITPSLTHSLEEMRFLEGIDLVKELEPTTFFFTIGRRASTH